MECLALVLLACTMLAETRDSMIDHRSGLAALPAGLVMPRVAVDCHPDFLMSGHHLCIACIGIMITACDMRQMKRHLKSLDSAVCMISSAVIELNLGSHLLVCGL
jgi:hypothetical protein